jgi:membrane protein DedA with SNARE-associated domain
LGDISTFSTFMMQHGTLLLFGVVFAEQLGLPLPATPLLVTAGALAGAGRMSLVIAIGVPVLACLPGDLFWYALGRRHGGRVLRLLCRISLEPDSCVRRTEDIFARHGVRSLLLAKFVPGLSTVTPPLAGMAGVGPGWFLVYDGLGSLFWVESFVAIGYLFSAQLERAEALLYRLGATAGQVALAVVAAYLLSKAVQRLAMVRRLRTARITPDELRRLMDQGAKVVVVDLRHPMDLEITPHIIPGALHLAPDELRHRHAEIPRGPEIILYCS